jgi:hypothetical protein
MHIIKQIHTDIDIDTHASTVYTYTHMYIYELTGPSADLTSQEIMINLQSKL